MSEKQVSLYYSEGSSDKEYHTQIVASNGGFVVNFQYGRRGSALQSGSKTSAPVDFATAEKIFNKLVSEKTAKGYSPGKNGTPYQGTDKANDKTGFVPQLCNAITEDEAEKLVRNDLYACQEKIDGDRRAVSIKSGVVTGINRKGLAVPLPKPIADELLKIAAKSGDLLVDGEIIGDILHVFDLHVIKVSVRKIGWLGRFRMAEEALSGLNHIKVVPVATTTTEKRALWNKVKDANGEGLVFKLKTGVVKEGRPNSGGDWLKLKFVESCSAIVKKVNAGKRSVAIELRDNGSTIPVGNVTIPPNYPVPSAGDIVEVEYLYAYMGGSLYQPVYKGKREDIDMRECVMGQLKFKPDGQGKNGDQ